jgi:AcrR family transcriptional regulator
MCNDICTKRYAGYSASRMNRRKRLELDERRSQLLTLARSAFSAKSYDDVSIDELSQAAGVSKGLLYHYFPSKRDLYVETIRAAADQLWQRTVPDPTLAPREQVFRGVDGYLRYVEENSSAFVSLMQSGIGRDQQVHGIVEDVRQKFIDVTLERMGLAEVPPIIATLVRGWVGMVEAASLDWVERRSVPREELMRLLVKTLLYTLQIGVGGSKASDGGE